MASARQHNPRGAAQPPGLASPASLRGRSVVVLGGTGFLGRHIHDAFGAVGARALSVSRRAAGGSSDVGGAVRLDLVDAEPSRLAGVLAQAEADVVVNAAGRAWQAGERQMTRDNADLVDRLIAAVSELPRPPRLIQLGTVHEYGPVDFGATITEDQPAAPITAYGQSKLRGAQAVLRAARTSGLDAVVLRIANVSGPGSPPGSLLRTVADHLADLHRNAGRGAGPGTGTRSPALRLAPLRAHRDFVDVRDVAEAVLAAARVPTSVVGGHVVNIGRGEAVSVRWMVDRLIALSGLSVPVVERPQMDGVGVEWQQLDISRARLLLGWQPRRSLEESLTDLLSAL
ncbi:NAD(P)-dependent oxidoreductase [Streptomyces pimonensis]|uniref:NAD(P)-dependent oxidoreductase n=1 Tax=Streptomyces pimonensis TaxID=2860288 RepID=A0ABV4J6H9_9ACTN